jgi:hypothetical protein
MGEMGREVSVLRESKQQTWKFEEYGYRLMRERRLWLVADAWRCNRTVAASPGKPHSGRTSQRPVPPGRTMTY